MFFTSVCVGKKESARSRYSTSSGAIDPSAVIAPQIALASHVSVLRKVAQAVVRMLAEVSLITFL